MTELEPGLSTHHGTYIIDERYISDMQIIGASQAIDKFLVEKQGVTMILLSYPEEQ